MAPVPAYAPTRTAIADIQWDSSDLPDAHIRRLSGSVVRNGTRFVSSANISAADLYRCNESSYAGAVEQFKVKIQEALSNSLAALQVDSDQTYATTTATATSTPLTAETLSTAYRAITTDTTITATDYHNGNHGYGWGGWDIGTSSGTSFSSMNLVWDSTHDCWVDDAKGSKKQEFLEKIRDNLQIRLPRRGELIAGVKANEAKAINTLREELSETEFRKYVKYGFVLVPGKSGKTYQVFRSQDHTKVWKGGKLLEEICVRIKDSACPPTDNVIAFKTMIEADEEHFRKCGNVYKNKNGCLQRVRAA